MGKIDRTTDSVQVDGDIRQANFRLADGDADWLRQICKDKGLTSAQGFALVRSAAESAFCAQRLPSRADDIQHFGLLVQQLLDAYTTSLDIAASADARVRQQYDNDLSRSNQTITDLQCKVQAMSADLAQATADAQQAQEQADDSQLVAAKATADAEAAAATVAEQRQYIARLSSDLDDAAAKIADYAKVVDDNTQLRSKLSELTSDLSASQQSCVQLKELHTAAQQLCEQQRSTIADQSQTITGLQHDLNAAKAAAETAAQVARDKADLVVAKAVAEAKANAVAATHKTIDQLHQTITALTERATAAETAAQVAKSKADKAKKDQ